MSLRLLLLALLAYALIKLIRPRSPQRYVDDTDWPLRWDVAPWERVAS